MIILIRHCRPKIDFSRCNYLTATKRVDEYNSTHNIALDEITPIKSHLQSFIEDKKTIVFASSMTRALITAKELFGKKFDIVGDDRFIEFDLRFIYIPFLKLKFGTWALISRLIWFMGLLKTKRSFAYEYNRAKNVSEFLYEKSKEGNIVLVAHGMLNMFVEFYLKKKGYKRIDKVKNGFFTIVKLRAPE